MANSNTQALGVVAPVPMGDWVTNTLYQKLNIVRCNGAVYMARTSNINVEPNVSTNWQLCWMPLVYDGLVTPDGTYPDLTAGQVLYPLSFGNKIYNGAVAQTITATDLGLGGVYTPQGSIAFSALPATPSASNLGYVWNITDSFTTDSRFVEGAGKSFTAGTNVGVISNNGNYYYDIFAAFVDLSNYPTITDLESGAIVVGQAQGIASEQLSNEDLNELIGANYWGKNFYAAGGNTVENKPISNGAFALTVLRGAGGITVQTFYSTELQSPSSSPVVNMYIRRYYNTWSDWEELVTADGSYSTLNCGLLGGKPASDYALAAETGQITSQGGFQAGDGADASYGGAIGNGAQTGMGGAVGWKADATEGGAIGESASTIDGGACGYSASTIDGGAVGYRARSNLGAAIGYVATAFSGGAIGYMAKAGNGFSGGYNAQVASANTTEGYIDAIQLGTGTNETEKTLQIYDDNIYNAATHTLTVQNVVIGGNDISAYALIADLESGAITVKEAQNAATATDSEKLGGVLSTEYAIKTGTYSDMTVGQADFANNAQFFGVCSTVATSSTKVVSIDNFTSANLIYGTKIVVRFTNANETPYPTLNVSNTGAKSILTRAGAPLSGTVGGDWADGSVLTFIYYNNGWILDTNTVLARLNGQLVYDTYIPIFYAPYDVGTEGSYLKSTGDGAPVWATMLELYLKIFPVGAYWITNSSAEPGDLFGGIWQEVTGQFILGADTNYPVGSTGGEAQHTLTIDEMPSHNHNVSIGYQNGTNPNNGYLPANGATGGWWTTQYTGGGEAHNNMPPYRVAHIWYRIQ